MATSYPTDLRSDRPYILGGFFFGAVAFEMAWHREELIPVVMIEAWSCGGFVALLCRKESVRGTKQIRDCSLIELRVNPAGPVKGIRSL